MKRIKMKRVQAGLAAALLVGVGTRAWADAKVNPYDPILARNPFGLKPPPPPPPPPDPEANKPPPPLATVELTGITSILSSKRALLEIIPGPGKPMLKPILAEGERVESVEVVSINVEKNEVTVKNGNVVTNLTFRVAKSTPAPVGAPAPGAIPGAIPRPSVPVPPPAQTSFNNPNQNQGTGRNAVMMAGGDSTAAPTPASTPTYGGAAYGGATPNYGGVAPGAPTIAGGDGSFRSIPSRNIRTPVQPEADPAVARLQNFEEIEHNRAVNYLKSLQDGKPRPPLPPTPLTPSDAPDLNRGANQILPPFPGQR
jgi:hypothetical protein